MNWKTRQMFSDREHGIVSGLSPVNMMGGGSVPMPGYQTGGDVLPQLSNDYHTHPELHSHGSQRVPGSPAFPEDIIEFNDGGIVPLDLFEEGDEDINEALNMMSGSVSPNVADIGPTAPTGATETIEETVTVTEDQGSGEYEVELQTLKETFKDEIRSYVAQAGTTDLEKYLQRMDVVYNNQLNKLKSKHGITEALPEDILLTEDFIAELVGSSEAEIPGFEEGGEVNLTQPQLDELFGKGRMPLEDWSKYSPKQKNIWLMKAQIARIEQDRTSATGLDMTELNRLIKERRGLAGEIGEVARSGYSSVQDPVSHFFSARKAGKTAELAAREKMIADEIALQQALLTSQSRSGGVGGLDFDFSAKESEALTIGDLIQDQKEKESLDKAWANIYKPNTYGDLPKFGKTLRDFVRGFGRRFPSGLTTNVRVYKNHVTGEDWQSTLPEYYDLVMKKASEIEDRKDREKYIEEELDKWPLLPLFTLEE